MMEGIEEIRRWAIELSFNHLNTADVSIEIIERCAIRLAHFVETGKFESQVLTPETKTWT